jgi:hypothetical protein
MFEEREVFSMAMGWAVLLFAVWHGRSLQRVPGWRLLLASFGLLALSWTASVVEGVVWEAGVNVLQHATSTVSAIAFAAWCCRFAPPHDPPGQLSE